MCNGKIFGKDVTGWVDFAEAARKGKYGFEDVPAEPGVYVLRVSSFGTRDLNHIQQAFESSPFIKAAQALDLESEKLFKGLEFGEGWGWTDASYWQERLSRLSRIPMEEGKLQCPLLYIGKASSLWRRMTELAIRGHTANAPFWALLMAGWKIEVGFRVTSKQGEAAEEDRLKAVFGERHGGLLPPLVHR
ncbi:hypothetical protein P2318_03780 [Myxococcaceae bacterium GXIMD 01537]